MIIENIQIGDIIEIGNQHSTLTIFISFIRKFKNSNYLEEWKGVLLDNVCYTNLNLYEKLDNIDILIGEHEGHNSSEIYYTYLLFNKSRQNGGNFYFNNEDNDFVLRKIQ